MIIMKKTAIAFLLMLAVTGVNAQDYKKVITALTLYQAVRGDEKVGDSESRVR